MGPLSLFFKKKIYCVYMCLSVCAVSLHVHHVSVGAPEGRKRASDSPGAGVIGGFVQVMGMLKTELRSSGRAASAVNCSAIQPLQPSGPRKF